MTSHIRHIDNIECDEHDGRIDGQGEFDVDTEYESGQGHLITQCDFLGFRIGGALMPVDLVKEMFGKTAVEQIEQAAWEQFQTELSAGDWREAA
ncbi:MAG: hypothetical protein AAFQ58_19105 [Pseudomonadota bacterium]